MKNIFEKFVKNLENLDNHCVLIKEKGYLILSTKITIVRLLKHQNMFQRSEIPRSTELSVFFLVKITEDSLDITNLFLKHDLPILDLSSFRTHYNNTITKDGCDEIEMNEEQTEKILTSFIEATFLK